MAWHYLTFAWRSLWRTPFQTVVSVLGLALGLTCFVAAYAFAAFVTSADRQYPAWERIFVVFQRTTVTSMGLALPYMPDTSMLLAEQLKAEIPELIEVGRSRELSNASVAVGPHLSFRTLWVADTGFTRIFNLPLLSGAVADTRSRQLLLTRDTALALFGRLDVTGESITVRQIGDVEVAGVLAPLPDPSHLGGLSFDDGLEGIIVTDPSDTLWETTPNDPWRWLGGARTYALLTPDGAPDPNAINARLPAFVARHVRSPMDGVHVVYELRNVSTLVRVSLDQDLWGPSGLSFVDLLSLLGALILAVACFNFASLATTRALTRAKEVGTRKALGARGTQIVAQHLVETLLLAGIATVLALGLLELAIRVIADTFALSLAPPSAAHSSFWLALLAIVTLVAGASGLYPAVVLSRAEPAEAFRSQSLRSSNPLRTLALTCQFTAASFLIALVLVVATQNEALRRAGRDLGSDPLVVIPTRLADAQIDPERFRSRLLESPAIKEVAGAREPPWEGIVGGTGFTRTPLDGGSFVFTQAPSISHRYFEALDTPVLAGRTFERNRDRVRGAADNEPATGVIVIDRLAAEQFGWPNPQDAVGQTLFTQSVPRPAPNTIIGVVEHRPARIIGGQMARAFVYWLDRDVISQPIIRISAHDIPAALAHIDSVWQSLAPSVPLKREFADERFERGYALFEHVGRSFVALAVVAIAIAAFGLLALAAYVLERRRREIGIRKTLGATANTLSRLLLGQFLGPVIIANIIALPLAFFAARAYLGLFVTPVALTPTPFVLSLVATALVAAGVVGRQIIRAVRFTPGALLHSE